MYQKVISLIRSSIIEEENQNLLLFLSGKSISLFGTAIYTFVVGLYLLNTTGSGLRFATNIVLYTIPIVFINPFAGVLADYVYKKYLVVGSDLINGLFLTVVYFIATNFGLNTLLIYLSTFLMTVFSVFFNIGIEAAKPNLVSDKKLVKINSFARIIESMSHLMGPILGGLIYTLIDTKTFILINGMSFLLAGVIELFINYSYNIDNKVINEQENKSTYIKLKEGFEYIFTRPQLKVLVYIFISLNFFFNFTIIVPIPYLLNTIWDVDSYVYGIVQSGLPIGMILGAVLIKKLLMLTNYDAILRNIGYYTGIGVFSFVLPLLLFSNKPSQLFIIIYYTLLMIMGGIIVSWVDIPSSVLIQTVVPNNILGRVISVKFSIIKIIVPISLISSGLLIETVPIIYIFIFGAFFFTIFNLYIFSSNLKYSLIEIGKIKLIKDI
ncbi:MAG: MFS transporter [Bacillota bacterium]